jgi:hypothetical protein
LQNNPPVQTLDLTDSAPRTEGRLKTLFWPSIQTADDVDYLGTHGFWVCVLVATFSLVLLAFGGHEILGAAVFLLYFLGGVGVREHSRFAAAVILISYVADTIAAPGVIRFIVAALLFSNLRATWIASQWNPESSEAVPPPRLAETWWDKLSDTMPAWLWPKIRIPFYVFSLGFLALEIVGAIVILRRHA